MIQSFRSIIARSSGTLAQDALGLAALVVLLYAGLHLPAGL